MPNSKPQPPLTFAEVLYEELAIYHPKTAAGLTAQVQRLRSEPDCALRASGFAKLVPDIFSAIHKLPSDGGEDNQTKTRSALCLSGGGIRSATFNLGILQGLARHGLLLEFEYLSTVSGGGFIGGWLSAWIKRVGGQEVATELSAAPKDPLEPEPEPIRNLRTYSNYLTPKKGLFTADTWTLVAVYLRNLLLNWLVFVPAIMAFLVLPVLWSAVLNSTFVSADGWLTIGWLFAVVGITYLPLGLPSSRAHDGDDRSFLIFCLVPLLGSAMALAAYWIHKVRPPSLGAFTIFALSLFVVPLVVLLVVRIRSGRHLPGVEKVLRAHPGHGWLVLGKYLVAIALIIISVAIIVFVTHHALDRLPDAGHLQSDYFYYYAALAVPLFLLVLALGGTLIAGFTSSFTDVDDQEWWARVGGWSLMAGIGWVVFVLLVLLGPPLLAGLWSTLAHPQWSWFSNKGVIATVIGTISGLLTLLGGSSSKTAAQGESQEATMMSKVMSLGMGAASAMFVAFLIVVFATLNARLLSVIHSWQPASLPLYGRASELVVMMIILALVSLVIGLFINTNKFSLHYYWRNRIMRAYLGSSREDRAKTSNRFTGFDLADNLQMHELATSAKADHTPVRPLHVVNIALNLVGGDRLEWQDRKAESFTVSPLHAGSFRLGYRPAKQYGGANGISLGTAVAISGAAASPNMGYMMTSPAIRFIMTLFNVRLGFWLGNPGKAGSNSTGLRKILPTFNRDSPRSSVRPIVAEALGMTNGKSPYVYLSDGGHFENLGLYEMVLRRCRFILVSDASTDPEYGFQSLAMAIRQIRVDLGVPIEMEKMSFGRTPNEANNYCAVGTIGYSCVDKSGAQSNSTDLDGTLIYLKPSLTGAEPRDVLNYNSESGNFPEETVADQWFSEAQFESYRMLGSHMIDKICNHKKPVTLAGFAELVRAALAPQPSLGQQTPPPPPVVGDPI
ncbi:MAG TPA: patatin-like phospholipase family protein [Pyrinomonadaceae bacterium]|jgi:hypothetical protein|nr:patatin-like phospholipase family protein [Pyrinomonadaceae bacterium]